MAADPLLDPTFPAPDERPGPSLWRNGAFQRFWAAATVSIFGSLVTRVALPFVAIVQLNADALGVALVRAMELVAVTTSPLEGGGQRDIVIAIEVDGSLVGGFPANTTGASGCDDACFVTGGYDQSCGRAQRPCVYFAARTLKYSFMLFGRLSMLAWPSAAST